MASDATIVEVPRPPAGRLPFLLLLARVVSNPVASWGRDFYSEPIVVYDDFGLQTVFVMDPELIQAILLDDVESFSKSPIYDRVLGEGGGEGVLIAEGEHWRWQRRLLAPLFRAEEVAAYVPAFVSACGPVLQRWQEADAGVRRQSFWDSERRRLREALARLADDVRRLADDAASVGLRWSVV
jgi:cytochrome P450